MSEPHGAEKESGAEFLYRAALTALLAAGLPPETRVQLVFDQSHMRGDPNAVACFGSMPVARLAEIVNGAIDRQRSMQADAVEALAKFTLSGKIRFPITGENSNG